MSKELFCFPGFFFFFFKVIIPVFHVVKLRFRIQAIYTFCPDIYLNPLTEHFLLFLLFAVIFNFIIFCYNLLGTLASQIGYYF